LITIDDNDDQADTVNPFDTDVSLRPGNLYANLVLAESEQLVSAAEAIEKLSAAAAAGQDTLEDFTDPVRDISDSAVRKTVEENQDLRRQVVFLQQTVEERDRRIRALENLLVSDRANSTSGVSSSNSNASMNTATQTEKLRPKSMGSTSNRSTTGDDSQAFISFRIGKSC
jgi:thiamine biosynthesis protein ThiC